MTKRCFTFVILIYTIVIIYECIWNLSPSSVYLLSWTHNWDISIFGHLTNFSFVSRGNHNIFSFIFLELIRMSSLGQRRRNHFLFCWENKNPDTSMNFTVKSRHLSFLFQFSQIKKETSYFDHYFIFPKQNSKFSRIFWNQLIYYFDWKKSFVFQPIPTCLLKFHIKLSSKYNGYMTNVACSHWEHAQCINTRTPTLAI